MNTAVWIIVVLGVGSYLVWSQRRRSGIQQMDPQTLQERLKENPGSLEIIDVREPFEFHRGHIATAQNIPLSQLRERLQDLPRDKDIVFVCRSGNRSKIAAQQAKKTGLTSVYNLTGGMSRWTGPINR